jgi:cyanate permease
VGTGAGQFTVPILASLLIAATGFQTAFIILGICAFALLMIIARFLYRDPDIYDAGQTGPAVPVPTFSDPVLRPRQTAGIDYSQALKSPKLWLLCLSNLLVVFCLMSIMLHIVPYARDMGISPIVAELFGIRSHGGLFGIVVCFGTTGGALGPFVTGLMFDRFLNYTAAFTALILIAAVAFVLMLCLKTGGSR